MPSRPVAASVSSVPFGTTTVGFFATDVAPAAVKRSVTVAQSRLSPAHRPAVRSKPNSGTSQKAAANTPTTAPKVLAAYSSAMGRVSMGRLSMGRMLRFICATTRSIAGSVAPMAAVAGNSIRKVPQKATVHCHHGVGCTPMASSIAWLIGAIHSASARLHSAMTSSQAAYQRAGCALRSINRPSASAPTASPPKKAVTTASTAAASWPSHSAHCCVQTIW